MGGGGFKSDGVDNQNEAVKNEGSGGVGGKNQLECKKQGRVKKAWGKRRKKKPVKKKKGV